MSDERLLFAVPPAPDADPEQKRRRRRGKPPAPITPGRRSADGLHTTGRKGVGPWILWHFADTGKWHPLKDIMEKVNPEGDISRKAFETTLGMLKRSGKVAVEMQPGAFGNHRYRFSSRTERLISLDEIEVKFAPLIEDLLKQAELPVSHQSHGRFRATAAALQNLLDAWAE